VDFWSFSAFSCRPFIITIIEGLCESSNELRIAFWFQMLEQKLRMRLEVLEVRF